MNDEFRVKVSVRNNLILEAVEAMGYTNLHKFAKDNGLSLWLLYDTINLKKAPLLGSGEFSQFAMSLMEVLGACPTDLWTEEQLRMKLRSNSTERVLGKEAMVEALAMNSRAAIENIEDKLDKETLEHLISDRLDALTPREALVLKMRYGFDEYDPHSLEEVAEKLPKEYADGTISRYTRERIRMIEAKALMKIRKHENYVAENKRLKQFVEIL